MKKKINPKLKTTPKAKAKRKYVQSHWLIFGIQGLVALGAGAYIMFTNNTDVSQLVITVGTVLIGLGIIEIFNILHRKRRQDSWGIPLAVALFETTVGITMIMSSCQAHELHIVLLAGYTLVRGVTSIVIGFVSFKDQTDRFLWVACGMVTSIIGFVILADQGIGDTVFIKLFGTFLMALGLTNIFYSIHSREQPKLTK